MHTHSDVNEYIYLREEVELCVAGIPVAAIKEKTLAAFSLVAGTAVLAAGEHAAAVDSACAAAVIIAGGNRNTRRFCF